MSAHQAALEALVRYFAVALGPRRITVNAVSPGPVLGAPDPVEGGVLRALPGEVQEAILAWHEGGWTPMRRLATPADVGDAVLLLCLEEAGLITGQVLHADGEVSLMDSVFPSSSSKGHESRRARSRYARPARCLRAGGPAQRSCIEPQARAGPFGHLVGADLDRSPRPKGRNPLAIPQR